MRRCRTWAGATWWTTAYSSRSLGNFLHTVRACHRQPSRHRKRLIFTCVLGQLSLSSFLGRQMSSKLESDVCCRLQVAPYGESYGGDRGPAGWLPVHRDQLRAQCSVTSMGKLYLFSRPSVLWWLGVKKNIRHAKYRSIRNVILLPGRFLKTCLQCFHAVGWAAGRASGL